MANRERARRVRMAAAAMYADRNPACDCSYQDGRGTGWHHEPDCSVVVWFRVMMDEAEAQETTNDRRKAA